MRLIDMTTGQALGQELPFSGTFPSQIEVVASGAGQAVRVTFSATDVRTVPIP
jgi:hypothetical protein